MKLSAAASDAHAAVAVGSSELGFWADPGASSLTDAIPLTVSPGSEWAPTWVGPADATAESTDEATSLTDPRACQGRVFSGPPTPPESELLVVGLGGSSNPPNDPYARQG